MVNRASGMKRGGGIIKEDNWADIKDNREREENLLTRSSFILSPALFNPFRPDYPIADADMTQTEVVGHDKKSATWHHSTGENSHYLLTGMQRPTDSLPIAIVDRKQLAMAPRGPVDTQFSPGSYPKFIPEGYLQSSGPRWLQSTGLLIQVLGISWCTNITKTKTSLREI